MADEITNLNAQIEKMEQSSADLGSVNSSLAARLKEVENREHELTEKVAGLTDELLNEERKSEDVARQLNRKDLEIKERDAQMNALLKNLSEKDKTIESLNSELKMFSESRLELEEKHRSREESLSEMNTSLHEVESEKGQLESEVKKLNKLCKGKDAKLTKVTKEKDEAIQMQQNRIEELEVALTEIKSILDNAENEKDRVESELIKLQKLYKGREVKVKKFEDVLAEQEKLMNDRDAELVILRESVTELNEKVEDSKYEEQQAMRNLEKQLTVNQQLQEQCQILEHHLEGSLQEVSGSKVEIETLRQSAVDSVKSANSELSTLQEENVKLNELLIIAEKEKDKAIEEKTTSKRNVEKMESEIKKVQMLLKGKDAKLRKASEQIEELEKLSSQLSEQCKEWENKYEELDSKHEQFIAEMSKLQKLGKGKEAKARKFEEVVAAQEKVLASKDADVLILQERVSDLSSKLKDLGYEEQELKNKLDQSVNNAQALESVLEEAKKSVEELTETIRLKNLEIEQLGDVVNGNKETILRLESEKIEYQQECENMKSSIFEIERKLTVANEQISELKCEIQSVLVEKEQLSSEIGKLKMVAKGKNAKLQKFEEVVSKQEHLLTEKETDIVMLNERINNLNETLNEKSLEFDSVKDGLEQAQMWEDRCSELEKSLDALQQNISMNEENQIHELQEKCSALENTIEFLQRKEKETEIEMEFLKSQVSELDYWKKKCSDLEKDISYDTKQQQKIVQETMQKEEVSNVLTALPQDSDDNILLESTDIQKLKESLEEKQILIRSIEENHSKELKALKSKLSKLKTLCKAKDAKIAKLQSLEENEEKSDNLASKGDYNSMSASVMSLDLDSSAYVYSESDYNSQSFSDTKDQISYLEKAMKSHQKIIRQKDEDSLYYQNQVDSQEVEIRSLRTLIEDREEEIDVLQSRIHDWEGWYQRESVGMDDSLRELQQICEEKDFEIIDMRRRILELQDTMHDRSSMVTDRTMQFESEIDELRTIQSSMASEKEHLQEKICQLESKVQLLEEENVKNKTDADKFKKLCKGKDAKLKKLEESLSKNQEILSGKEQEMEVLQRKIDDDAHSFSSNQDNLSLLQQSISDADREKEEMRNYIDKMNSEHFQQIQHFESMLSEETNQILSLKQKVIETENRMKHMDGNAELVKIELDMFKKEVFEVIREDQVFVLHEALESATNPVAIISLLRKEFSQTRQSLEQAQCQVKEKDSCLRSLDEENKSLMDKVSQNDEAIHAYERRINDLVMDLQENDRIMRNLTEKISRHEGVERGIQEDKVTEVRNLEAQITRLKDNLSRQGNEMQNLQMLYNSVSEQLEDTQRALDEASNLKSEKMEEQETAIKNLRERVHELGAANNELEDRVLQKDAILDELQQIIKDMDDANSLNHKTLSEKESEIQDLQTAIQEKDSSLEVQQEKCNMLEKEREAMKKSMQEFNEANVMKMEEKESAVAEAKLQLSESVELAAAKEAQIQSLKEANRMLNEEGMQRKSELEQLTNEISQWHTYHKSQEAYCNSLKEQDATTKQTLIEKESEITDLMSQVGNCRKENEQCQVRISELTNQVEFLQQEFQKDRDMMNQELNSLKNDLMEMTEKVGSQKLMLDKKEQDLSSLEGTCQQQRQHIDNLELQMASQNLQEMKDNVSMHQSSRAGTTSMELKDCIEPVMVSELVEPVREYHLGNAALPPSDQELIIETIDPPQQNQGVLAGYCQQPGATTFPQQHQEIEETIAPQHSQDVFADSPWPEDRQSADVRYLSYALIVLLYYTEWLYVILYIVCVVAYM